MLNLWLYFGDAYKDITLPDIDGTTAKLALLQSETGWAKDATFDLRYMDKVWYLAAPAGFLSNDKEKEILLRDGGHDIFRKDAMSVAVNNMQSERTQVQKYALALNQPITIGREEGCGIRMDSPLVSALHGTLIRTGANSCTYRNSGKNGSFLNHKKMTSSSCALRLCDEIFIAPGIKLIYLGDHIALSLPAQGTLSALEKWAPASAEEVCTPLEEPQYVSAMTEVSRSPRLIEKRNSEPVEVEPPISKSAEREQTLLMTIGPSLTMVLPMTVGAMMTAMNTSGSNFMLGGLAMMGTSSMLSVAWGIANYRRQKKNERRTEEKRNNLYRKYINEREVDLRNLYQREYKRLLRTNPSSEECLAFVASHSAQLWERMPAHPDFLEIRLGLGIVDLPNEIGIPKQQLSMIDDLLREEPKRLKDEYGRIKNAPITLNIQDNAVIGLLGRATAQNIASVMVMQLATLHSYHDVKIVILSDESHASVWDWARWLPHTFPSEDRTLRMVVNKPQAIREVLTHMEEVFQMRTESEKAEYAKSNLPHYVVFCMDPLLLETEPILNRLLTVSPGFTLVITAPRMDQLPKECKVILSEGKSHSGIYSSVGDIESLAFDRVLPETVHRFSQQLATMRVRDHVMGAAIPSVVTFLELYHVRDVANLDVWRFWSENHAFEGLRSTIGLRAGAQPFVLDISDKKHGPHGLVAGTTGSGKSVMLQTYILSLALNYHPREVQFILIDYKGGGMSDAFRDLPHLAGSIDNLQGVRSIRRALASVQGEIRRREALFKNASVSNVDEYMRMVLMDTTMEPLAHLIIVVDEFAELKKEQPEFMHELISASRVGRSVGIHLILATQKPSNSVDDEIWSNARFRICLRVQNRTDSMDMLKRPDASYIKGMGRCYVQIGNDEIFEEVQTSWSGADYKPEQAATLEKPLLLNDAGQPIRIKQKKQDPQNILPTQMNAVLRRIGEVMEKHDIAPARRLWLDALPPTLDLMAIAPFAAAHWEDGVYPAMRPESITATIGLADDLQNQMHVPVTLDFTEHRNHVIVGLAASGKTTLLQTIALSLCMQYTPDQVHLYVLSLTSRTLGSLEKMPHIGDIVFDSMPDEVPRLLNTLLIENERRRKLFDKASTDNFVAYQHSCAVQPELVRVPAIVILVDRIAQLLELLPEEDQKQQLFMLLREASSRGLYFVATALSIGEVPFRLRDSFHGIALQLHERADYTDVVNKRLPAEMSDIASHNGRGIVVDGDALYEMQVATYMPNLTDTERAQAIRILAKQMNTAWQGARPPKLPRVPENPTWDGLLPLATHTLPQQLPLAYLALEGVPLQIDLYRQFSWLVFGTHRSGKTDLLRGVATLFASQSAKMHLLSAKPWENTSALGISVDNTSEAQHDLLVTLSEVTAQRNTLRKALPPADQEGLQKLHESFEPIVILMDDLHLLLGTLDPELKTFLTHCAGDAFGYGIYIFASIAQAQFSLYRSDPLVQKLASVQNGVALCKLADCDVWDVDLPFALRNRPFVLGQGYCVDGGSLKKIIIPKAKL